MISLRTTVRSAFCALPAAVLACARTSPGPQTGALPAPSAAEPTTPAISEQDLRTRLYIVADDSMGGRPTGSPGHIKTSDYIAAELKRIGLRPAGDNGTYFQNVPFVQRGADARELSVEGNALSLGDEFLAVPTTASSAPFRDAETLYIGFADDSTTWPTREQAAGKFVLVRQRNLQSGIGINTGNPRFADARGIGVTGLGRLFTQVSAYLSSQGGGPAYRSPDSPTGKRPAYVLVSDAAAARLLGQSLDAAQPGALGKKVSGSVSFQEAPIVARNVVAILPGSDAALRGQYVAISAHLDHDPMARRAVDHDSLRLVNAIARRIKVETGRDVSAGERAALRINLDSLRALRPARRDSILNGADDDGSGTVAMLEIAEALAAAPRKPQRSIIFVWHVAEELGLIGATHFTDHPTVPRDSIVANLNMDMIGRGGPGEEPAGGPDYLQLIGWRRLSNELGDIIEKVNQERTQPFKFDLTYDAPGHPEQYYCRSDHAMYARYGIPVAFFSTGDHGDYHQVTDEPQYIDYSKLKNVTQLVHDIALRVANLDHRVALHRPKPDPRTPCRQ